MLDTELQSEEELLQIYKKKVLFFSRQFFLLGGDGDDLFQEGMIGLLSAIRNYDSSHNTSFSTYADYCIKRRMIDAIKSQRYSEFISSDEMVAELSVSDPEKDIIEEEKYFDLLNKCKTNLSKYEFNVLDMYLKGYNYSEIAKMFDKSSTSVYNAIQRIRFKLSNLT